MKMEKMKVISILGAIGLTAGALAGCAEEEEEYIKVVDSEGKTVYIEEDEYESNSSMFMLFGLWNGSNHSKLKPSSGFTGKVSSSKPTAKAGSSGLGSGKSSGS